MATFVAYGVNVFEAVIRKCRFARRHLMGDSQLSNRSRFQHYTDMVIKRREDMVDMRTDDWFLP